MIDYSLFRRRELSSGLLQFEEFDVFLSALNDSTRVKSVFNLISAARKVWLVHDEYGYAPNELPTGDEVIQLDAAQSEVEQWRTALASLSLDYKNEKIAVDITGMMRPAVLVLPIVFQLLGAREVTVIYSDPDVYAQGASTTFSKGEIREISVVPGLGGMVSDDSRLREILVIGAGYDHNLVRALAESRRAAEHIVMVGLPGLQPHMYQESLYRISLVSESISGFGKSSVLFAPASDPFVTAQIISGEIRRRSNRGVESIQLAPVGTKAQVLGFGWYHLIEGRALGASVLFPYSERYERETSAGLGKVHVYQLEFDAAPRLVLPEAV